MSARQGARGIRLALAMALGLALAAHVCFGAGAAASAGPQIPQAEGRPLVRNIILFIGDGCGFNQIEAATLYQFGRRRGQVYQRFPVRLAVSTYAANEPGYDPARAWSRFSYVKRHSTDSAAAATAMATGIKTVRGALGVDAQGKRLVNVLERAEHLGKATGVVTSVRFCDATPGAFVAHSQERDAFESIALAMIQHSALEVLMGCSHPGYDPNGRRRIWPNNPIYVGGEMTWKALGAGTAGSTVDADHNGKLDDAWTLLETRADFRALAAGPTPKRVFGVPRVYSTLQQERSGESRAHPYAIPLLETVPTLAEMTLAGLNVLDDDPDGFVLVVEGGAIDWANHSNQSGRLIEEVIDFSRAIEQAVRWVRARRLWHETVVLVTADHESGYLTGPGSDPEWTPLLNNGRGRLPGMEWHSKSHTNSLVPFFAKGVGAALFIRYADQSDPVRGRYLDNTEIGRGLFRLLGGSTVEPKGTD